MHQTFYIDIDEEITSIIEKLRKSRSGEVVIVVPKRALLIQSIINLKLLKKEADELNKEIIIVTQDKFGKLMVEKAGITVEQRLENIDGEEIAAQDNSKNISPKIKENLGIEPKKESEDRLNRMGSSEFFDSQPNRPAKISVSLGKPEEKSREGEKLTNIELVSGIAGAIKSDKKINLENEKDNPVPMVRALDIRQRSTDDIEKESANMQEQEAKRSKKIKLDKAAGFFQKEIPSEEKISRFSKTKKTEADYQSINLPKKSRKLFSIFILIAFIIAALAGLYLFLPKATVTIHYNAKSKSLDLEAKADAQASSADYGEKIMPAKSVSLTEEISKDFNSTGSKGANNYKARGTITIYNEYSSASQPLVATTRFLSEEGKLFRLIQGVVVPGSAKIGNEIKPGAIEAEVAADESGEEYNIGPTKFTIPGFQNSGNEKYAKIYAKSFKAMAGGGKGGETVKVVSQADIDSAKKEILDQASSQLKEKIKNELGPDFIILDDGINYGNPAYSVSSSAGNAVDSFGVNLKIDAKAIAFNGSDLKRIISDALAKTVGEGKSIAEDSISYEFGKTEADFPNNVLNIKVHAAAKIMPALDLEAIKKGILGKREDEVAAYLKDFSDITTVDVSYFPTFISGRIPLYGNRVKIILDNNQ